MIHLMVGETYDLTVDDGRQIPSAKITNYWPQVNSGSGGLYEFRCPFGFSSGLNAAQIASAAPLAWPELSYWSEEDRSELREKELRAEIACLKSWNDRLWQALCGPCLPAGTSFEFVRRPSTSAALLMRVPEPVSDAAHRNYMEAAELIGNVVELPVILLPHGHDLEVADETQIDSIGQKLAQQFPVAVPVRQILADLCVAYSTPAAGVEWFGEKNEQEKLPNDHQRRAFAEASETILAANQSAGADSESLLFPVTIKDGKIVCTGPAIGTQAPPEHVAIVDSFEPSSWREKPPML